MCPEPLQLDEDSASIIDSSTSSYGELLHDMVRFFST